VCFLLQFAAGTDTAVDARAFVKLKSAGSDVAMDPCAWQDDQAARDVDVSKNLADDDCAGAIDVAIHASLVIHNEHAVCDAELDIPRYTAINLDPFLQAQGSFEPFALGDDGLDVFGLDINWLRGRGAFHEHLGWACLGQCR